MSQQPGPVVVAHRGASAEAPENTLAAFGLAVEQGADRVELDVQRSRDGHLVVLHDAGPGRTTDVAAVFPGRARHPVSSFTLAELRRLDAGGWKGEAWRGERVPELTEALALLDGAGVGVQLELKTPAKHPGIVADLVSVLAGHRGDVVVQSFDEAALRDVKARMPDIRVGLLGRPSRARLGELISWAGQVNPPYARADQRFVDVVRLHGLECFPWTVNRPETMRRLACSGVDGLITDRPGLLCLVVGRAAV